MTKFAPHEIDVQVTLTETNELELEAYPLYREPGRDVWNTAMHLTLAVDHSPIEGDAEAEGIEDWYGITNAEPHLSTAPSLINPEVWRRFVRLAFQRLEELNK